MVKLKHESPMEYRVIYRINGSAMLSKNYYSVFHSSEALVDLLHTLKKGSLSGDQINIVSVDEWCRYRKKWLDRTSQAFQETSVEHLSINGENINFNKDALTEGFR